MALEATHMRFALDLKDEYRVSDLARYIMGTIYPDSRYVTCIIRPLTHPKDYTEWDVLDLDDFKKGWHAHLLCDKVQWQVTKEMRPELFEGEVAHGSPVWIRHTALKVLQDFDDVKKFDVATCLGYLDRSENPNGEDLEKIRRYHRIFQDMYRDPATLDVNKGEEMWLAFGVSEEVANAVKAQVVAYQNDATIMDMVAKTYDRMIERCQARM